MNKDILGVFFSCVCLLHCLTGPVLILMGLSSISFVFLESEWIHYILIAPMLLFAIWSIPSGFKIHQKTIPLLFACVGIFLFIFGILFAEEYEDVFTISASLMLIIAHLYNRYLLKKI